VNPRDENKRLASALLLHLVMLHPMALAQADLVEELNAEPGDPDAWAAVDALLEELSADGLIERRDGRVLPTRAALRSYELWGG
jgi:hypothetical protein